jgi:3-methylcrotonyl-CoA carboxylase alpha subunit
MIRRLLVANRGEIAVRVARGAREMGIAALGVYSEADAQAYHLRAMDDARCIGPAPASQSYLNGDAILAAARAMEADAVHPGYGFLSENAAFARAVRDAGLIFVGPPPEAIAAAGSKIEAKRRARDAGVPTVPGYDGAEQSPKRLREEAERIGFPVLIKASAGGGGRGMRVVTTSDEFDEALASAQREATGAFGDATVLLERYLRDPRHIEFQILADAHGTVVHLGERECSIQRRHQKVVEEAPSVALTPALRAEMGTAAVRVAQSVGYVNAGTVEFMLDADGYYFLEMNARLQVEHPVTEMVYGVDLVQWQLRIASGEALTLRQADLVPRGWAVEARVTAEDPAHGMLPSSGTIARWDEPEGPGVRVDGGIADGSVVGLEYDSLLAKLIVHADDRASAIARLQRALDAFRVEGVRTNLPLLRWIARDEAFRAGDLSTSFFHDRLDESRFAAAPPTRAAFTLAAASMLLHDATPWRLANVGRPLFFEAGGERVFLWATATSDSSAWRLAGAFAGTLTAHERDGAVTASLEGERVYGTVERDGERLRVTIDDRAFDLALAQPPHGGEADAAGAAANGLVAAPMPGRVVRVAVAAGDDVDAHRLLVVLEAMKMEHRIEAPSAATVRAVLVREGETVTSGAPLVELA